MAAPNEQATTRGRDAGQVDRAKRLIQAVIDLPWYTPEGMREPPVALKEARALQRAEDALLRALISGRYDERRNTRAFKRRNAAEAALAAVVGDFIAWVLQAVYSARRAIDSTNPAEWSVLDSGVDWHWRRVAEWRLIEQGWQEAHAPQRSGATKTNERKPATYRKRNADLLALFETAQRRELEAMRSEYHASAEAYRQVAAKARVKVERARDIIAQARAERLTNHKSTASR